MSPPAWPISTLALLIAGERVGGAAAADALDISLDVVELAGLAVVGAVTDRRRHRRAAWVVGEVRPGVALQRVAAGAALQRVGAIAALQDVEAVAALQRIVTATAGQRVVAALADQHVRVGISGQRVGGAAAPDTLDIALDVVAFGTAVGAVGAGTDRRGHSDGVKQVVGEI